MDLLKRYIKSCGGGNAKLRCDICGKESEELYEVVYMGRRGYACPECIKKYGLIRIKKADEFFISKKKSQLIRRVKREKANVIKSHAVKKKPFHASDNFPEFVEEYGRLIKRKREDLGLTQEDLARELKVKVSYIKKIESEILPPSIEIARKIEKVLKIKLFKENDEEEYEEPLRMEEDFSITIGDLIKFKDEERSE